MSQLSATSCGTRTDQAGGAPGSSGVSTSWSAKGLARTVEIDGRMMSYLDLVMTVLAEDGVDVVRA